MISVLINAYACSPNMGSEPGMGWNWCVNLAKYCELHIITEGEFRAQIEAALPSLPQGENMHFYYNPVSEKIRRMCWNQGDWRFYYYYRKWQKKTLRIAKKIIQEHHIDIIHQLNMVGFREPGFLWEIKNIPYVWGPIGGMEIAPLQYYEDASISMKAKTILKNNINKWQMHHCSRVIKGLQRANALIAATKNSLAIIQNHYHLNVTLINETGTSPLNKIIDRKDKNSFDIIWVGRFIYTKQLNLALKTIERIRVIPNLRLHIVGEGFTNEITQYYKVLAKKLQIENYCIWHGNVNNGKVQELMQQSDLMFFTSIMEATSTVILEAIQNQLPIVCFNTCGFGPIVDEKIGIRIELSSPQQSVQDFGNAIQYLYEHPEEREKMGKNCIEKAQQLSWDTKAQQVIDIYNNIIEKI